VGAGVGKQRPAETLVGGIEALARQGDNIFKPRQTARRRLQMRARFAERPADGTALPLAQPLDLHDEIGKLRHRPLGSLGRRRCARVGDEIDQGPVGLMADGRDERDAAFGGRAHHDLFIEAPEIFQTAAAARHNQHIGTRDRPVRLKRVEAADGGGDFSRAALALHAHRPDDDVGRKALIEAMQHIADDGTRR